MIRLAPLPAYDLAEALEHAAFQRFQVSAGGNKRVRGEDDFAVDVELMLGIDGIADAHRPRPAVSAQMVEFLFLESGSAVHVVHDLKFGPGQARCMQKPSQK